MKKNNTFIADDEIDFSDLIRIFWREKILILFISIIFGLLGYLNTEPVETLHKIKIKLKNPPFQLFEQYIYTSTNNIADQFISDFELKLLSLDNLENFVEESRDLDTFKKYLKSINIPVKQYFTNNIEKAKESPNTYFLVYKKEILDGGVFFSNYVEYTKNKAINELKKNLKFTIENKINVEQNALEIAKSLGFEDPILKYQEEKNFLLANDPSALFYLGTRVLLKLIAINKKLLQKLENDQFNYDYILEKGLPLEIKKSSNYSLLGGLFAGFFLSCVIIFFKWVLKIK